MGGSVFRMTQTFSGAITTAIPAISDDFTVWLNHSVVSQQQCYVVLFHSVSLQQVETRASCSSVVERLTCCGIHRSWWTH